MPISGYFTTYVPTHRSGSLIRRAVTLAILAAQSLTAQTPPAGSAPVSAISDVHSTRINADSASAFSVPRLHRERASSVPLASHYFDLGLSLHYRYRHAESVRAFREAQRHDPHCVMCVVGEAIALGPTIDTPVNPNTNAQARAATRHAVAMVQRGDAVGTDAAWVRAIATRYSADVSSSRFALDTAYANAMAALADAGPDDADAQTLAAEAAMVLSPYNYWSESGEARPGMRRAVARLQRAMHVSPGHHGACYLYVHVMESVNPRAACALRRSATPDIAQH
jgi:hypothetical protein